MSDDKWRIGTEKTIYKSKLFSVKEHQITFPNKKKKIYDFVERKPTAVIFPLTSSYELYLISEFRTLHKKFVLEAIAGHINDGELPIDAAKRELKEEAGLMGESWEQLIKIEGSGSVIKSTSYLFLTKGIKEGKQDLDEDEEIKLLKMPLNEAVSKVLKEEITISTTVIGILILDKMRREGNL